jgi:diaminopimelate epimerase
MDLEFFKYQGTGNDFIMIDNRKSFFDSLNTSLVKRLCDRRFGIGADGLILLEDHSQYDFNMIYFNSDGTSSMCGNGGRCIVKFAFDLGVIGAETTFMAIDGEHDAHVKDGLVYLKMKNVEEVEEGKNFFYMNTGSPHYVEFVKDIENFPVFEEGYKIRNNDRFKQKGTNVNFVEEVDKKTIWVRTYERGVEDETFSCGTGVTAASIASFLRGYESPVKVITKGGELIVSFSEDRGAFSQVYLAGPAEMVFKGVIKIG